MGQAASGWLRLMRLPNVFTAQSDVLVGLFAVKAFLHQPLAAACVLLASTLIYIAGIIENDVADLEEDQRDRPDRPLPSGMIPARSAGRVAHGLYVAGLASAVVPYFVTANVYPAVAAMAIAAAAHFYNTTRLGRRFGPALLGLCRALNMGLGFTLLAPWSMVTGTTVLAAAAVLATYVLGFSLWARHETSGTTRAVARIAWFTINLAAGGQVALVASSSQGGVWGWLLVIGFVAAVNVSVAVAARHPTPPNIGRAVGRCITLIIVLDAGLAAALAGPAAAAVVLLLLAPHLAARRWLYVT